MNEKDLILRYRINSRDLNFHEHNLYLKIENWCIDKIKNYPFTHK